MAGVEEGTPVYSTPARTLFYTGIFAEEGASVEEGAGLPRLHRHTSLHRHLHGRRRIAGLEVPLYAPTENGVLITF